MNRDLIADAPALLPELSRLQAAEAVLPKGNAPYVLLKEVLERKLEDPPVGLKALDVLQDLVGVLNEDDVDEPNIDRKSTRLNSSHNLGTA